MIVDALVLVEVTAGIIAASMTLSPAYRSGGLIEGQYHRRPRQRAPSPPDLFCDRGHDFLSDATVPGQV